MIGQPCPLFTLPSTSGETFSLATMDKPLVMYFYPKDHTPGCTNESIAFRDSFAHFQAIKTHIVGISRDSLKTHYAFKEKLALPFDLLSDTEETVCTLFDVIKTKMLYGRQVRSIERSTFIIDSHNTIVKEWRALKVAGHVQEVLTFLQSL